MRTKDAITELKILLTKEKASVEFYGKRVAALEMAIEELSTRSDRYETRFPKTGIIETRENEL